MGSNQLLKGHELFRSLTIEEADRLSNFSATRRFDTEQVIFNFNAPSTHVYMLMKGAVDLRLPGDQGGSDLVVSKIAIGELFGLSTPARFRPLHDRGSLHGAIGSAGYRGETASGSVTPELPGGPGGPQSGGADLLLALPRTPEQPAIGRQSDPSRPVAKLVAANAKNNVAISLTEQGENEEALEYFVEACETAAAINN